MFNVDFSGRLEEGAFVSLIKSNLSYLEMSREKFKEIDFDGKSYYETGDLEKEIVCRVIAAKGFERFKSLEFSAFSWDRATKSLLRKRFPNASLISGKNSLRLYELIRQVEPRVVENVYKEIYYARDRISRARSAGGAESYVSPRTYLWRFNDSGIYLE